MRPVKNYIRNLTKPIIRKNGFVTPQIIYDWPLIVGENLAAYTSPLKILYPLGKSTGGCLHIEVISVQAPIVQQLHQEIIHKISVYCGFAAISRIKLIHTHKLPPLAVPESVTPLTQPELERLDKMLAGLEDEDLKLKLKSIGEYVIKRPAK